MIFIQPNNNIEAGDFLERAHSTPGDYDTGPAF